jgi:hypothetical protein
VIVAVCIDCGTEFKRPRPRGPIPHRCAACLIVHQQVQGRGYTAAYRGRYPERIREYKGRPESLRRNAEYMARRRAADPEGFRQAALAAYRADPDASTRSRARAHGLTVSVYKEKWAEQDGRCAICRTEETVRGSTGRVRRLAIDHDHESGEVRGLLCHACNVALGLFDDDPELLEAAAGYLRAAARRVALHVMEG